MAITRCIWHILLSWYIQKWQYMYMCKLHLHTFITLWLLPQQQRTSSLNVLLLFALYIIQRVMISCKYLIYPPPIVFCKYAFQKITFANFNLFLLLFFRSFFKLFSSENLIILSLFLNSTHYKTPFYNAVSSTVC